MSGQNTGDKVGLLTLAVIKILKPLIAILLRNGMSYNHFDELVKKSYVDVAFDEFKIPGKKQTISRVAALTGLTRKEVKRLHEIENIEESEGGHKENRATRVISGWLTDSDFSIAHNIPKKLFFDEGDASFTSLVKRYSGDIPSKAMLDLLVATDNIHISGEEIQLIKHVFIPHNDSLDKIKILGNDVCELLSTLNHNLSCSEHDLRFQRKVSNRLITLEDQHKFQLYSAHKSQLLLEDLNVWLGQHEKKDLTQLNECHYVSVGIYYYQDKMESSQWLQNKN